MAVICPKCSHVRPPDASNPDWQCPKCGICYAKFNGNAPAPRIEAAATGGQGLRLGWLFKVLLLLVLVLILKTLIERRQAPRPEEGQLTVVVTQEEEPKPAFDAGVAFANAAISTSGVDGSLLHSLSGRLERTCARNKYGLSESDCIARFRAREDGCAASTAQRFPGQIGDTGRMKVLVDAYLACIFHQG